MPTPCTINVKRLLLAIVAVFAVIFFTDFMIHGLWLKPDYTATASLWRTEAEMQSKLPWMFVVYLLAAVTFVMLWARGFANGARLGCAVMFGLMMGLFMQANTIITYVVIPMPASLAIKWFVAGLAQAVLVGIVTFFVYKPAPVPVAVSGAAA
jgi:hypothetical protein